MTLSLVAVFIPVLFMGGLLGRLFHEFAVTISVAILVSGVVSLTLTPMLCSRFLHPEHAQPPRARCTRRSSASTSRSLGFYERTLRLGDGPPPRRPWLFSLGILAGTVRAVHGRPQGLHPERGHRPASSATHRDRRGHLVRGHGAAPAGGGGDRRARTPTWTPSCPRSAAAAARQLDEPGPHVHPPQARAPSASSRPTRSSASCSPSSRRCPASACSCRTRRSSTSAAGSHESQYQFTLQGTDLDALYAGADALLERGCASCPSCTDVTSDLQIKNPQVDVDDRPRPRRRARRDRAADRGGALRRLRLAPGLDHLHAEQPVLGDPRAAARVPARPRRAAAASTSRSRAAQLVPLGAVATLSPRRGPAHASTTRARCRR